MRDFYNCPLLANWTVGVQFARNIFRNKSPDLARIAIHQEIPEAPGEGALSVRAEILTVPLSWKRILGGIVPRGQMDNGSFAGPPAWDCLQLLTSVGYRATGYDIFTPASMENRPVPSSTGFRPPFWRLFP